MGNFKRLLVCVLSVLISVKSQFQNYQPQGFPYVLGGQQYPQPLGMQYGGPYIPYGIPQQTNYGPVNIPDPYQGGATFPYPYQFGTQNIPIGTQNVPVQSQIVPVSYQGIPSAVQSSQPSAQNKVADPYAGIKTEMIDIDPAEFRRLMSNQKFQTQIVSYETKRPSNTGGYAYQPFYIIKTENKQYNKTIVPHNITRHNVESKSTTFNKTFVLHPDDKGSKVVNLTFVNGVQVTESPKAPEELKEMDETTASSSTALPKKDGGRRFIDVPGGCAEGSGFSSTGGCFSPFKLGVNGTQTNTTATTSKPTGAPEAQLRRNHGRHH